MRLSNGFVIDKEKTFGELKFTAVRDVFLQNEDGTYAEALVQLQVYGLPRAQQVVAVVGDEREAVARVKSYAYSAKEHLFFQ